MKKIYSFAILSLLVLCTIHGYGQDRSVPLTIQNVLDSAAFDFWLGTWQATWSDGSKTYHATNTITRQMNGHFIHESFEIIDGPQRGYKGESYSTLDQTTGLWKQTWVDNQGAYLDFIGRQENDAKIFERSFKNKSGETIRQRMLFKNIKPDSFDWDWQVSRNGADWKTSWFLKYQRVKN